jgi:hypothetical protein
VLGRIAERRREVRTARRVGTATLAIAVVALTVGATWGLARVFRPEPSAVRGGSDGGRSGSTNVPSSTPLPTIHPTVSGPSPSASDPAEPLPMSPSASRPPPDCVSSSVIGDFDGDGAQDDTVTIECAYLLPSVPDPPGGWMISVEWPPTGGSWPVNECEVVCRALAAYDFDGDGTDELVVVVREQDGIQYLGFYSLRVSEIGPQVVGITPPGSDGFAPDQPAAFPFGVTGVDQEYEYVTCSTDSDGSVLVHQTSAVYSLDMRELTTRETVFNLISDENGDPLAFEVVSSHTEVHQDPAIPGSAVPTDVACWRE